MLKHDDGGLENYVDALGATAGVGDRLAAPA